MSMLDVTGSSLLQIENKNVVNLNILDMDDKANFLTYLDLWS